MPSDIHKASRKFAKGENKNMTIFRKNEPPRGKKCIFIGKGKENVVLLHRSIFVYFCGFDWLENMPYIRGAENRKNGRRN